MSIEDLERRYQAKKLSMKRDDVHGAMITRQFRQSNAVYLNQASVWDISENGKEICYLHQGRSYSVRSRATIVSTGAIERPVPIPGWTLPGVMTVGGAQTLLKTSGRVPSGRIVLLGCGPLLHLAAQQLTDAGGNVVALLQTTSLTDFARATLQFLNALWVPKFILEGLSLLTQSTKIHTVSSVRGFSIVGEDQVHAVEYTCGTRMDVLDCDVVLLHFGVIPNTQITRLAGADHEWNDQQRYWRPITNTWRETSISNFMVAGDGGVVLGAEAAEVSGRLSALGVAYNLGNITKATRDKMAKHLLRQHHRYVKAMSFLDTIYHPPFDSLFPAGNTIVCRCEGIRADMIEAAVANGGVDMRRLKAHTRAGMGPCRGQMCSMATAEILSKKLDLDANSIIAPATVRPPIRPLTIGQLADHSMQD